MECLFCKIAEKEIPSSIVYEDDEVVAFNDINPQAPVHVIIIPRKHIAKTSDITFEDIEIVGRLVFVAKDIAEEKGVTEAGYRLVFNCNKDAGQAVFHIHLHLLGGRKFFWPPG